jgi:hypothetical protein
MSECQAKYELWFVEEAGGTPGSLRDKTPGGYADHDVNMQWHGWKGAWEKLRDVEGETKQ